MKMIETGNHILTGGIYYFRVISAILVVIITVSFVLSCLAVITVYALDSIHNFLLARYPVIINIIKCILGILTFSALVWVFITQPLYEKGKELKKAKETKANEN
jgi:hypothetical protein